MSTKEKYKRTFEGVTQHTRKFRKAGLERCLRNAALVEYPSCILNTYAKWLITTYKCRSRGSNIWTPWITALVYQHNHTETHISLHIREIVIKNWENQTVLFKTSTNNLTGSSEWITFQFIFTNCIKYECILILLNIVGTHLNDWRIIWLTRTVGEFKRVRWILRVWVYQWMIDRSTCDNKDFVLDWLQYPNLDLLNRLYHLVLFHHINNTAHVLWHCEMLKPCRMIIWTMKTSFPSFDTPCLQDGEQLLIASDSFRPLYKAM